MINITSVLAILAMSIGLWFGAPMFARRMQTRKIEQVCGRKKLIALTFDDGPDPELTRKVLDMLDELQVKASFFMIGARACDNEVMAREVAKMGHLVAGHTQNHLDAWRVGPLRGIKDCREGMKALKDRELAVSWFRPPKGHATLGTMLSCRLQGCRMIWWTHDSGDTGHGSGKVGFNPRRVLGRFLSRGRTLNAPTLGTAPEDREGLLRSLEEHGGVVLLHDGERSHREYRAMTLECTREIVIRARAKGFRFVTLDDLN